MKAGCTRHFWLIAGLSSIAACSQGPAEPVREAEVGTAVAAPLTPAPTNVSESSPDRKAGPGKKRTPDAALCKADETPIFACNFADGKQVAVCGLAEGGAEYRFGGEEPELTLFEDVWATVPYSGGGEAQIQFSNGDTNYIVFSRMVRTNFKEGEPNNPAISDGVIVERSGELLSFRVCDGAQEPLPIQYDAANAAMKRVDELFTFETSKADP